MFSFSQPKVTDAQERDAITELRKRLEDGSQPVYEQLKKGGEAGLKDHLDDWTLLRWLRAEDHNVGKAESRLRKHAIWREENFPAGRVLEEEIKDEIAANKVFMAGYDNHGRRILFLKTNRHVRSTRDLKQCIRFLCYSLDKAIALADLEKNPDGKICGLFDLRDLGMSNIDQDALRGVFDMLQSHYPERLGQLWMFESPLIFWALWKAVSPFIDPVTKKKVTFVSEKTGPEEMSSDISSEVLPDMFGGKAKSIPIHQVAVDLPEQQAAGSGGAATNGKPAVTAPNGDKYPENGQAMGP